MLGLRVLCAILSLLAINSTFRLWLCLAHGMSSTGLLVLSLAVVLLTASVSRRWTPSSLAAVGGPAVGIVNAVLGTLLLGGDVPFGLRALLGLLLGLTSGYVLSLLLGGLLWAGGSGQLPRLALEESEATRQGVLVCFIAGVLVGGDLGWSLWGPDRLLVATLSGGVLAALAALILSPCRPTIRGSGAGPSTGVSPSSPSLSPPAPGPASSSWTDWAPLLVPCLVGVVGVAFPILADLCQALVCGYMVTWFIQLARHPAGSGHPPSWTVTGPFLLRGLCATCLAWVLLGPALGHALLRPLALPITLVMLLAALGVFSTALRRGAGLEWLAVWTGGALGLQYEILTRAGQLGTPPAWPLGVLGVLVFLGAASFFVRYQARQAGGAARFGTPASRPVVRHALLGLCLLASLGWAGRFLVQGSRPAPGRILELSGDPVVLEARQAQRFLWLVGPDDQVILVMETTTPSSLEPTATRLALCGLRTGMLRWLPPLPTDLDGWIQGACRLSDGSTLLVTRTKGSGCGFLRLTRGQAVENLGVLQEGGYPLRGLAEVDGRIEAVLGRHLWNAGKVCICRRVEGQWTRTFVSPSAPDGHRVHLEVAWHEAGRWNGLFSALDERRSRWFLYRGPLEGPLVFTGEVSLDRAEWREDLLDRTIGNVTNRSDVVASRVRYRWRPSSGLTQLDWPARAEHVAYDLRGGALVPIVQTYRTEAEYTVNAMDVAGRLLEVRRNRERGDLQVVEGGRAGPVLTRDSRLAGQILTLLPASDGGFWLLSHRGDYLRVKAGSHLRAGAPGFPRRLSMAFGSNLAWAGFLLLAPALCWVLVSWPGAGCLDPLCVDEAERTVSAVVFGVCYLILVVLTAPWVWEATRNL